MWSVVLSRWCDVVLCGVRLISHHIRGRSIRIEMPMLRGVVADWEFHRAAISPTWRRILRRKIPPGLQTWWSAVFQIVFESRNGKVMWCGVVKCSLPTCFGKLQRQGDVMWCGVVWCWCCVVKCSFLMLFRKLQGQKVNTCSCYHPGVWSVVLSRRYDVVLYSIC